MLITVFKCRFNEILTMIFLFVVMKSHYILANEEFCTIEEFQNCLKLLQSVGNGESDLALPINEDELESACVDLKEGVVCLDLHIQKCFSLEMQQVYTQVATDAKLFVRDLCDNFTTQREYLRHAKCFRNVSLDEHKCAQKYREAVMISSDLEGKDVELLDKERIMRKSCCALQEFVECKNTHVIQDCGERASLFMQKHLHRITNPIMDQHCSAYTFGQNSCKHTLYTNNNAIKAINHIRPDLFTHSIIASSSLSITLNIIF